MQWAMDVFCYGGALFYVLAAAGAVAYLRSGNARVLTVTTGLTALGALCLTTVFGLRWGVYARVPLTTPADALNLMVLWCTVIMIPMERKESLRTLICFYLHPIAFVAVLTALVAHNDLHVPPRELRGTWLTVHVGLALLSYALFFMASMTSLAYIIKARHLKLHHHSVGALHRLPSLEQLDHTLYRMIRIGYPLFGVTLALGLIWTYAERDLLGQYWYLAPKVLMSFATVLFFSAAFHGRRTNWLRGPKLANFVFSGATVLLGVYVVMALLHVRDLHFWGNAA